MWEYLLDPIVWQISSLFLDRSKIPHNAGFLRGLPDGAMRWVDKGVEMSWRHMHQRLPKYEHHRVYFHLLSLPDSHFHRNVRDDAE